VRHRGRLGLGTALLVVATIGGSGSLRTLAAFTDRGTVNGTLASDSIAPPTGLAATGGTSVGLAWTPTVDTFATGYSVWRASAGGGPYTSVGSVTPGSATSTTDAPAPGTWFYVLRSVYGSWSSPDSNQASATVSASSASTSYAACVNQAPDTTGAGDNDGYQTTPALACADGGGSAEDPSTGTGGTESCGTGAVPAAAKDRHRFWGYVTGLPGSVAAITGIRVRADLGTSNNGGTTNLCAQLSWNGGTTWTSIKSLAVTGTGEITYTFGSTSDTWGRAWTVGELDATNLVVRIIDASSQNNKRFELDYLAVSVTYTP
jgi:hypothetical protein